MTAQRREGQALEFGMVLRKMRKRADLSQEQLAERLHLSRSNISRLESGKLELKARDLIAWAKETNAQDMMIAFTMNVDVTVVTELFNNIDFSSLTNVAGIILGGF